MRHRRHLLVWLSALVLTGVFAFLPASYPKIRRQPLLAQKAEMDGQRRNVVLSTLGLVLIAPSTSKAAANVVVDERSRLEDKINGMASNLTVDEVISDEVVVMIDPLELQKEGSLGVELSQVEFRTNTRVYVKTVRKKSLASRLGIKQDWIVVRVNGSNAERTNAEGVSKLLSRALKQANDKNIEVVFRDPTVFQTAVQNITEGQLVTTSVAPEGDTTQRNEDGSVKANFKETSQTNQQLTVQQLIKPGICNKGATTDDLLEISYLGTLADSGQVFDGSTVAVNGKGIPGRGGDVSLFFVLGKQPFGQFPPGWDVGLQGMCVGERRRLVIPPVLAYGSNGLPRRGIPPDATLQYDVSLLSINGLAMPQ